MAMSKTFVAAILASALGGALLASQTQKSESNPAKTQSLTFDLSGVDCAGCADQLTATLREADMEVQTKTAPRADPAKAMRVVAIADKETDLPPVATKVATTMTAHSEKAKPGLSLVLFAEIDDKASKSAVKALGKLKGIDAKASKADGKKGEISVRFANEVDSGRPDAKRVESDPQNRETDNSRLTVARILNTLKEAGVEARTEARASKRA